MCDQSWLPHRARKHREARILRISRCSAPHIQTRDTVKLGSSTALQPGMELQAVMAMAAAPAMSSYLTVCMPVVDSAVSPAALAAAAASAAHAAAAGC